MPVREYLFCFAPDDGSGSGSGEGSSEGEGGEGGPGDGSSSEPPAGDPDDQTAAALKQTKKEAQDLRKRLRDAEKERDDLKASQQTEQERTVEENKKLKAETKEATQQIRSLTVQVLAGNVGITEAARADVADLLDWSSISDPSDQDEVTEALRELVKAKPYLAGNLADGADGGASGKGQTGADMNALIRQAAGR